MKNSVKILSLGAIGVVIYFYFKNKKSGQALVDTTGTDQEFSIKASDLTGVNEPTQVLGATLPDGTTATGASNIATSPVDVVPSKTSTTTLTNTTSSGAWQTSSLPEAESLSKEIVAKINKLPSYKTSGTLQSVNNDIKDLTNKMFILGYAPNGDGGVYKITVIPASNTEANALSAQILEKVNAIPRYKTKSTHISLNKDIYDLSKKMFELGFVPDGNGGSYRIG